MWDNKIYSRDDLQSICVQQHYINKIKRRNTQVPNRYNRIDSYLMSNGFSKSDGEPTLYIKAADGNVLIVVLYVDDLIFTGNDKALIGDFKEAMKSEFEMTDLGLLKYFLGIEVKKMHDGIFISQEKYARKILERLKM